MRYPLAVNHTYTQPMAHTLATSAAAPRHPLTTPNPAAISTPLSQVQSRALTAPPGSGSSTNTFLMSASPVRSSRKSMGDGYKPKMISTIGAKPACLVNASVTYVGDDQIYAFGGFDQFTDEVYNHVLRLNLVTRQWNLVDNYGDIPGVRMGKSIVLVLRTALTPCRPYCVSLAGQQAAGLRWRERTSPTSRGRNSIRPQDGALDSA
jgi:hypothetical protein